MAQKSLAHILSLSPHDLCTPTGEAISIKTLEVKNLAKSVLLGLKHCETKDLFSAHAQIMTVNMNVNGSLKLSVVISWK